MSIRPAGAGPGGDIVGFSTICPHKGFPLNYVSSDRTLNCPGHYSRFDYEERSRAFDVVLAALPKIDGWEPTISA